MGTKTFKQTFPDFTAVNRAFATVCATSEPKLSTFFPSNNRVNCVWDE
jgi:hypothetical protein